MTRFKFDKKKLNTVIMRFDDSPYKKIMAIAKDNRVTIPATVMTLALVGLEEYEKEAKQLEDE